MHTHAHPKHAHPATQPCIPASCLHKQASCSMRCCRDLFLESAECWADSTRDGAHTHTHCRVGATSRHASNEQHGPSGPPCSGPGASPDPCFAVVTHTRPSASEPRRFLHSSKAAGHTAESTRGRNGQRYVTLGTAAEADWRCVGSGGPNNLCAGWDQPRGAPPACSVPHHVGSGTHTRLGEARTPAHNAVGEGPWTHTAQHSVTGWTRCETV